MTLQEKIRSGKFVVLGEFEPPKGADFLSLSANADLARGRLDAIVVPEMANAVLKASSLGGCAFLQRDRIESVFQVCCRDRNRLALQADILSAAALGIKNLMAVPGEDIRFGDHPQARTVNDLDLMGLLEAVQKLRNGKDLSGIELRGAVSFCVGSTLDTGAPGGLLNIELENLKRKADLGVEYVLTNPIFDLRRFEQFIKRINVKPLAVIPTVLLLKSAGMARYIDRNIKGISIPPEIIRDIQKAPDKLKECVRVAARIITTIKDMGNGREFSSPPWGGRTNFLLSWMKRNFNGSPLPLGRRPDLGMERKRVMSELQVIGFRPGGRRWHCRHASGPRPCGFRLSRAPDGEILRHRRCDEPNWTRPSRPMTAPCELSLLNWSRSAGIRTST